MSDWKSRADEVTAPSDGSWKSRAIPTPTSTEEPGIIESAARGAEQGVTLGFGDEVNSALETLLNQATGKSKDLGLLDEYRKHRDESRQAFKAAEEAHPWASGAGNLIGAVAPVLASGGLSAAGEGLGAMAANGAAYGGLAGLGNSTADLTQGDINQAAKDTATGAAMGAVTAPIVGKLGEQLIPAAQAVGGLVKGITDIGPIATAKEALNQGLNGRLLLTKTGNKALGQEITDKTAQLGTDVQDLLNNAKAKQQDLLLSQGQPVNLSDWVGSASKMMKNLRQNKGQVPGLTDDISRIGSVIKRFIAGSEEEGVPGIGFTPNAEQANTLKQVLGKLGSASEELGGLKTNEGKELINRLISPYSRDENLTDIAMNIPEASGGNYNSLKELVNESRPGLENVNSEYHNLLEANKIVPSINDVVNSEKNTVSGIKSSANLDKFLDALPEDIQNKYGDDLRNLSKAKYVGEMIENSSGLSRGLAEKVANKMTYGGFNAAGYGINKASNKLYSMTPDSVKQLANKVISSYPDSDVAKSLGRILGEAADKKDEIGRNALFFSLQQNPSYRAMLKEMEPDQENK